MEDVIQEISEKMVRRHPHVFGKKAVKDAMDAVRGWDEIKKDEKLLKHEKDTLRYIPKAFPSLMRAKKVLKKAEKLYFAKEKEAVIISSMGDAIEELRSLANQENSIRSKELIGTLILDITKLSQNYKIDADEALNKAIETYITTYEGTIE